MLILFPPPEDDWWRSEMGKRTCRNPDCGEDRLTHSLTDWRGEQLHCDVCGETFWILGKDKPWRE